MKKKKIVLIVSALVCTLLAGITIAIAFSQSNSTPKYTYSEEKTYHIGQDYVYYTQERNDGQLVRTDSLMSINDVVMTTTSKDSIVLDEDIVLEDNLTIKGYFNTDGLPYELDLNINLDLNGYTLSSDSSSDKTTSLIDLQAPYGKINLTIKNGKLIGKNLKYIFSLRNNGNEDNLVLNIEDIECETVGEGSTPILAQDTSENVKVNAVNSKFIAKNADNELNTGVGAFINSKSKFNFTNCYFEGGDALYVKQGEVNLDCCKLINSGLGAGERTAQASETFNAIGACLVTDSYNDVDGNISQFNITVKDCEMIAYASGFVICNIKTCVTQVAGDAGLVEIVGFVEDENVSTSGILTQNSDSSLDIISCKFRDSNPQKQLPASDIITFHAEVVHDGEYWVVG